MSRKIYATVTVCIILDVEEGENIDDVLKELDVSITSGNDNADILDCTIGDSYEITDSK